MNSQKQTCDFVRCRKIIHIDEKIEIGFCKFHFKVEKQKFILFVKRFGLADVRIGMNKLFMLEKETYREVEQEAVDIVKNNTPLQSFTYHTDKDFDKWWLGWVKDVKLGENVK